MKKFALISIALLSCNSFAFASKFPKPVGHVNDFAGVIPESSEKELEIQLRDYEKKTDIEIAVVTVSSLEGMEVEDFTQELVSSPEWKVGKASKNNGVVLLVAPNDRRMRIHTGYGMEEDMPDALAKRIINEVMIPLFKQGRTADGIVAGTASLIRELGTKPFVQRQEERRLAAEKRLREERLASEHRALMAKMTAITIIVSAGVLLIGYMLYSWYRRRKRLQEQYKKNTRLLADCDTEINSLGSHHSKVESLLASFKLSHPREVWGPLAQSVEKNPQLLSGFKTKVGKIKISHLNGTFEDADSVKKSVQELQALMKELSQELENIENAAAQAEKAQKDAHLLLKNLPGQTDSLREKLNHQDVSSETRERLKKSEAEYEKVLSLSKREPANKINWLKAAAALAAVEIALRDIDQAAEKETASAAKSRMMLKNIAESLKLLKMTIEHDDVSDASRKQARKAFEEYDELSSSCRNGTGKGLNWVAALAGLVAIKQLADGAQDDCRKEIAYAAEARKEGPKLLRDIPATIRQLESVAAHNDVTRNTESMVEDVKKEYRKAERMAERTPVDWVAVYRVLTGVVSLIEEVEQKAKRDKDAARRRREEERRRREEEEEERRRSSYSAGISSGSSWSSGSSGGSSGGGSSFGGFGGGSFGGGGASGSW